jgi:hypothetical protein
MSKSQEIRDALSGGAMTFAELHAKVGGDQKKLRDLTHFLSTNGEVTTMGRGAQLSIALKGAVKRKKATKTKRSARKTRPYKRIARKLSKANHAANGAGQAEKVLKHALTTFAALEAVLDIDEADVMIATAFRSHKEALEFIAPAI